MAQVLPVKVLDAQSYRTFTESTDELVIARVESTLGARSLWADAAATSVVVGGGTSASSSGHQVRINGGVGAATFRGGSAYLAGGDGGSGTFGGAAIATWTYQ